MNYIVSLVANSLTHFKDSRHFFVEAPFPSTGLLFFSLISSVPLILSHDELHPIEICNLLSSCTSFLLLCLIYSFSHSAVMDSFLLWRRCLCLIKELRENKAYCNLNRWQNNVTFFLDIVAYCVFMQLELQRL